MSEIVLKNDEIVSNRILNDMNDGVIVISFDGEILYINDATTSILGIDKNIIGLKYAKAMMNLNNSNDEFSLYRRW